MAVRVRNSGTAQAKCFPCGEWEQCMDIVNITSSANESSGMSFPMCDDCIRRLIAMLTVSKLGVKGEQATTDR